MNLKKTLAMLLACTLCLSAAACAKKENPVEESVKTWSIEGIDPAVIFDAPTQINEAFDQRLVGVWTLVSEAHNGNEPLSFCDVLYVLPNGQFFSSTSQDMFTFWEIAQFGLTLPTAATTNGTIDLIEKIIQFTPELAAAVGISVSADDAPPYQIETRYEFADINASLQKDNDGATASYFTKYDNDKLTFHLDGVIQDAEFGDSRIDSILVYERAYPILANDSFLHPSLAGTWTDHQGSSWYFFFDTSKDHAYEAFHFMMTDANGKVYTGDYLLNEGAADGTERIVFSFVEDAFQIQGTVVSFDGESLVLDTGTSTNFVLARE